MAPRPERWRFEWRRTWPDVWSPAFERTWRDMVEASQSAHVYHEPALVRAWADTCGRAVDAEPMVGIARSRDGVELLLPWVVVRYPGRLTRRRTLEPAGGDLFAYHNPLVAHGAPESIDWERFWPAARAEIRSACDQALFRLLPRTYVPASVALPSEDSPVLRVAGRSSLDAVLNDCSSNHRTDVRRKMRRLADRGAVTLWTAGPDDVEAARAALQDGLWQAYRTAWRDRHNTVLRSGIEAFLAQVVAAGVPAGWAHLSVLRVGDEPIAWHLGYAHRGRLYWWLPTHESGWSSLSPGKLLLAYLIDAACRSGFSEIHFLTGDHAYKAAWKPAPQPLAAIRWTAPTMRGRLMAWYDARRRVS